MTGAIRAEVLVSEPFQENTWIVWREGASRCLIVDPGLEPELIIDFCERHALEPEMIVNTHGHADHIGGNRAVLKRWPSAPLAIGSGDAPMLSDPVMNLSRPFGMDIVSPPADRLLMEGDRLSIAGIDWRIVEIPGHSPGHIVLIADQEKPVVVLGGDVLFSGSIGRTDFPGGNHRLLIQGIQSKLFILPEDTIVHSGHGPSTTIGIERKTNPFCGVRE